MSTKPNARFAVRPKAAPTRDACALVEELGLAAHPEGGFYRELFRSERHVATVGGGRSALTVIYFLLTADSFSAWHRLRSDETWHFAAGTALTIETLDERSGHERILLGPDGPWVAVIPAGTAFAAHLDAAEGFALVSCCVAPGFDFADFQLLDGESLAARFPEHRELALRYARSG